MMVEEKTAKLAELGRRQGHDQDAVTAREPIVPDGHLVLLDRYKSEVGLLELQKLDTVGVDHDEVVEADVFYPEIAQNSTIFTLLHCVLVGF